MMNKVVLLSLSAALQTGAFTIQPSIVSPASRSRTTHPLRMVTSPTYANGTSTVSTTNFDAPMDDLWDQRQDLDCFLQEAPFDPSIFQQQQDADKEIWNARLLLIGAAALYGTNFSFVKLLGDIMPVGVSSTLRFGLAALATLPWLLQKGDENEDTDVSFNAALAGFEVGLWNSVGYIAQAVGLGTTDASKSAFLCSLAVVVVPLLDFMFGKKLLPREIAGVVMAVLGVGVLELGDATTGDMSLSAGDICSLIQPLAFGMGFWKMEKAMRKFPQEANRSTAAQLMAVFLASGAYAGVVGVPDVHQILGWCQDPKILLALFWTGCITTALTVYMETLALKTLSAAETTLIFSTEPLWGAACASVVMGEQLGMGTLGGGAMILAGCVVSNLGLEGILGGFNNKDEDASSPALPDWMTAAMAQLTMGTAVMTAAPPPAFASLETDSIETNVVEEVIKNAADSL